MNQFGNLTDIKDIIAERKRDVIEYNALKTGKKQGRIRTGIRAVPSSATDVIQGDAEGDIVTDATYIYELVTVSGSLKWDRRAHSVGW